MLKQLKGIIEQFIQMCDTLQENLEEDNAAEAIMQFEEMCEINSLLLRVEDYLETNPNADIELKDLLVQLIEVYEDLTDAADMLLKHPDRIEKYFEDADDELYRQGQQLNWQSVGLQIRRLRVQFLSAPP